MVWFLQKAMDLHTRLSEDIDDQLSRLAIF